MTDRRIDCRIAEIKGWTDIQPHGTLSGEMTEAIGKPPGMTRFCQVPYYSSEWCDAGPLLEEMHTDYNDPILASYGDGWRLEAPGMCFLEESPTRAIALAFLGAQGVEVE